MTKYRHLFVHLIVIYACLFACDGCSKKSVSPQGTAIQSTSNNSVTAEVTPAMRQECDHAARKTLGAKATVLECGQLTHSGVLETLAVIKLKGFKDTELGVPVSSFVILRKDNLEWKMELMADRMPVRNGAGYVGVYNIDDSADADRYRIDISGGGSDAKNTLFIMLRYIDPDGETEAWPVGIGWNPVVQRFQEYSENGTPLEEIKNPKHFRSKVR